MKALSNSKGREIFSKVDIAKIEEVIKLKDITEVNKVEKLIDYLSKKENFDKIFKIVEL